MPRTCNVCGHPEREDIDKALVANGSYRELSALKCVSEDAIMRHKTKHLLAGLVQAQETWEVARRNRQIDRSPVGGDDMRLELS